MMRRPTRAFAAAVGVVSIAVLASASAIADATSSPAAALTAFVCHHALKPSDRSVSVTAVMRPIAGTAKLAVNFRLLQTSATGAPTSVRGTGLDAWLMNPVERGADDVWRVIQTVSYLPAPASYRFTVAFRWIGSGGQIIAHAVRRSRRCREPELRPNLEVQSIAVQADASKSSEDDYLVGIYDAGASGAGPFQVQLLDQGEQLDRRVTHIGGHQSLSVRFVGPACMSVDPPTVTVDPQHRVDVSSRARASLTAICPAASGGAAGA